MKAIASSLPAERGVCELPAWGTSGSGPPPPPPPVNRGHDGDLFRAMARCAGLARRIVPAFEPFIGPRPTEPEAPADPLNDPQPGRPAPGCRG